MSLSGRRRRPASYGAVNLSNKDIFDTDPTGVAVSIYPAQGALLIGDFVFLNASGQAQKSTTLANYTTRAGLVVGGKATDMMVSDDVNDVGLTAATTAGDGVLVAFCGIFWAIADAAIAAAGVLVGINGTAITTAGRVVGAATVAGSRLGVALSTAAGAGSVFKVAIILG